MSGIDARIESWRDRLLDIGNRNALINCSFHETRGAIEIVTEDSESLWQRFCVDSEAGSMSQRLPWRRDLVPPPEDFNATDEKSSKDWNPSLELCRASRQLKTDDLLTRLTDKMLDRRLRTLQSHSRLAMSEQGVHAVFAVFGLLKWVEKKSIGDEGTVRYSPLLLVPISLYRSSTKAAWEIFEAEDDAYGNLCLAQRLLQDYDIQLPPLPSIDQLEEQGARLNYLAAVRQAVQGQDGWEVEDRCIIGRFAFPKIAMWEDLGLNREEVASHPLTRLLADDATVQHGEAFGPVGECPKAETLDDTFAPGEIKTILDCDSSQLEAIAAARKGVSFVLDGPPGTGKSQTIANIIAEALAVGRTVLFVSEKSAALDVVKRRLDEKGLGSFCLECHSSKANRKSVLYELEQCLALGQETYPSTNVQMEELARIRAALNAYVRHLHRRAQPFDMSPFEVFGKIGDLQQHELQGTSRFVLPDPTMQPQRTIRLWNSLLEQATEHRSVLANHEGHPWRDCILESRPLRFHDELSSHVETFVEAAEQANLATSTLVDDGLLSPLTIGNLREVAADVSFAASAPDIDPRWLESPEQISSLVLKLTSLDAQEMQLRSSLTAFAEDAPDRFDADVTLVDLAASSALIAKITDRSLRTTARHCQEKLQLLTEIETQARTAKTLLLSALETTGQPIRPNQPVRAIPFISKVLNKITAIAPLKEMWFRKQSAKELLSAVAASISDLREASTLKKERSAHWTGVPEGSFQFAQGAEDLHVSLGKFTETVSASELLAEHEHYTSLSTAV